MQAWQFGGQQLLITLGGEPVVDWALKFKQEFGPQTWVAGYCNDVMTYIPSLRVLKEDVPPLAQSRWGYEGVARDTDYGLPGSAGLTTWRTSSTPASGARWNGVQAADK